jgi:hypothetical protein
MSGCPMSFPKQNIRRSEEQAVEVKQSSFPLWIIAVIIFIIIIIFIDVKYNIGIHKLFTGWF